MPKQTDTIPAPPPRTLSKQEIVICDIKERDALLRENEKLRRRIFELEAAASVRRNRVRYA